MPDPFGSVLGAYYATLDRYRLLTYGQQVVRAVRELERPELAAEIHAGLRHLIVDEYQDVNPAQERLIRLLTGPQVELCVVGDDQQAIYQWRGSDVSNIVTFPNRYPSVATFEITTNRRSRPSVIDVANDFARTHPGANRQDDGPPSPVGRRRSLRSSSGAPRARSRRRDGSRTWSSISSTLELAIGTSPCSSEAALPTHGSSSSSPPSTSRCSRAGARVCSTKPEAVVLGPHHRLAHRHRMERPLRSRPADRR